VLRPPRNTSGEHLIACDHMPPLIRRAKLTDTAAIARLYGEPEVFGGLLQLPYAPEELWRERIERDNKLPGADIMLVAEVEGRVVATAGLHNTGTAARRRHAMGLGIGVGREHQGKGIGKALMAALMDYADNWAHVLRIELTVYTGNVPAIALYKHFGFVQEGLHRAYALRAGQYVDAYTMARLHPHPPQLPPVT
jgi:L-phenylalanine/L-methionine N-acetyltransferase